MSTIEYLKLCIPLQVAAERIEKLRRKAEHSLSERDFRSIRVKICTCWKPD
jgi:hypothetical protein